MKQLLIKIFSLLVDSENKIEIKKPEINFKEGFNRIVMICFAIYLICDAISVITEEYRTFYDFLFSLVCCIGGYIAYLLIINILGLLLNWIWMGFTGKKRKRSLIKEWQIKYKYWNRTCKRMDQKYDKEHLKQENYIEYNRNPFVPKGRMKRLDYFIYSFIFNFIAKLVEIDIGLHPEKVSIYVCILFVVLLILGIFITRNRIYDITLSNKKAWWFSILFQLSGIVLSLINPNLIYLLTPFGVALIIIPSKTEKENGSKEKEQNAFDFAREMNKKN